MCLFSTSTFLCEPTYKDTSAHNHKELTQNAHHTHLHSYEPTCNKTFAPNRKKMPSKRPPYTHLLLRLCKIIHTSFTSSRIYFCPFICKTPKMVHHTLRHCFQFLKTHWKHPTAQLGRTPIKTRGNWKPARLRASGHHLILQKHPKSNLVDYHPIKGVKIEKVILLDTLPIELLYTRNYLITIPKYNDKHVDIFKLIKILKILFFANSRLHT